MGGINSFVNEYANLIQTVLGIVSLVVSVILAILIYKLQLNHEAQIESLRAAEAAKALREEARLFRLDHGDELDYLPLAQMAVSTNKNGKNYRRIYSAFIHCRKELRMEILRQSDLVAIPIEDSKWFSSYIGKLENVASKYHMGKSLLYDGGKYFRRAFENFPQIELSQVQKLIDGVMGDEQGSMFPMDKFNLIIRIDRYLDTLPEANEGIPASESNGQVPPYDFLWEKFNLKNVQEEFMDYWAIQVVYSTLIALNRHNLIRTGEEEWRQISTRDAEITTYEDLYYLALLELYKAFAPTVTEMEN